MEYDDINYPQGPEFNFKWNLILLFLKYVMLCMNKTTNILAVF